MYNIGVSWPVQSLHQWEGSWAIWTSGTWQHVVLVCCMLVSHGWYALGSFTALPRQMGAIITDVGLVAARAAGLARADLPHLELREGPVRGLVQIGEGEAVGLVGAEALHAAEHPVVVPGLLLLGDVLGGPGGVPAAPRLELAPTHRRVGLQMEGEENAR